MSRMSPDLQERAITLVESVDWASATSLLEMVQRAFEEALEVAGPELSRLKDPRDPLTVVHHAEDLKSSEQRIAYLGVQALLVAAGLSGSDADHYWSPQPGSVLSLLEGLGELAAVQARERELHGLDLRA
jgi:hypothetical protein